LEKSQVIAKRGISLLNFENVIKDDTPGHRNLRQSGGNLMHIALLSSIAWRTPPRRYGPWERVVSLLAEGLVEEGIEVTLFATQDSVTKASLRGVVPRPYEEDRTMDPKVWGCLHISEVFENAHEFDLIHNHFDFQPLTYSRLVKTPVMTTIHGFSSPKIVPVYKKYNDSGYYVSISNADRSPELDYFATVYHGIDLENFTFSDSAEDYLLFFGRIHHDKGVSEAIQIAREAGMRLLMAGVIQDEDYYARHVEPWVDGKNVEYIGVAGPEERDELMGGALGLLHPINFHEPFGLSVVEANACGTPVIAFPKGSMPELIQNGVNGFLVQDIQEAVKAIPTLLNLSRQGCRELVEKRFSQKRMVTDYINLYRSILTR
jgi:glycosyltransferase involved in cell wall biosynthesis